VIIAAVIAARSASLGMSAHHHPTDVPDRTPRWLGNVLDVS